MKSLQINSAHELILTELILENTLASYEPEEVAALLSSFVFQEKTDNEPALTPNLEKGRKALAALAAKVGRVQDFHKVSGPSAESAIKFGLAEVVYEWARGMVGPCRPTQPGAISSLTGRFSHLSRSPTSRTSLKVRSSGLSHVSTRRAERCAMQHV